MHHPRKGPRAYIYAFAIPLFLLNINCISVPSETNLDELSPRLQKRVCSDSKEAVSVQGNYSTPTKRLTRPSEYPYFTDDLNFTWMQQAITRQLKRYQQRSMKGSIRMGDRSFPLTQVIKSLKRFSELMTETQRCLAGAAQNDRRCYDQLNSDIRKEFDVFAPDLKKGDTRYGEENPVLFTAYYTPLLKGQRIQDHRYQHAIYSRPDDESLARSTRTEIDFDGKLANTTYDVIYTQDLFELYILQVEGGGKVVVEGKGKADDEYFYLTYDGTNRRSWRFISQYMIKEGMISSHSIVEQRDYLRRHPDRQKEIYSYCPSYVYFKKSSTPPLGNDAVPLTDNRSIATDDELYRFKGLLSFIKAKRPIREGKRIVYRDFSRFVLDQDTGGAINGKGRVDIYFGEGEYAELAAHTTKSRGELYFLMLKK